MKLITEQEHELAARLLASIEKDLDDLWELIRQPRFRDTRTMKTQVEQHTKRASRISLAHSITKNQRGAANKLLATRNAMYAMRSELRFALENLIAANGNETNCILKSGDVYYPRASNEE